MKECQIVLIEWVDQSWYHGPTKAENAICPTIGNTIGFFLKRDKDWTCIAAEKFFNDECWQYRQVMTFPNKCIVKIKKVKL